VSLGVDKFSFLAYNVYIVNSENERENDDELGTIRKSAKPQKVSRDG